MKQLRPLRLDFVSPSLLDRPKDLFILALGLISFCLVGVIYLQTLSSIGEAEERQATLEKKLKRLTVTRGSGLSEQDQSAFLVARESLGRPWNQLFNDLENSIDDSVTLLRIDADPLQMQINLTAEARQFEDAVSYVKRLAKTQSVFQPSITNHKSRDSSQNSVIEFSVQARWRKAE